jgi:HD superfamily phosphohydrolase
MVLNYFSVYIIMYYNFYSDTMMQGYSTQWQELVSDLLAKKENGLEYTGLTDYYRLLDEYLDGQFDPSINEVDEMDEYQDPPEPETKVGDDESIELSNGIAEETYSEPPMSNNIDTGDELNSKFGSETSTVAVLEIKKAIDAGDQKNEAVVKEASYNVYWWIGIGVALAVVVMLIAIIARKRQNHRKQLERQRRNNTRA